MNLVVLPRIVSKTLCMLKYFKSILNFTKMIEKACFANVQPSVFVEQYPVSRFSLKIFYGHNKTKKKTWFAFFTICKCCLHTKQHPHLCRAAAPLQWHGERGQADAVSSISELQCAAVCVSENLHRCNLDHISTLSVSRRHTVLKQQQDLFGDLISSCHKQAPLRTKPRL